MAIIIITSSGFNQITLSSIFNLMEGIVLRYAVFSRTFLWIFAMVANILIKDYDSSSQVNATTLPQNSLDKLIELLFGQFSHWDAVYFLRIAQYGYEYEQNHAFFPMLPLLLHITSYSTCTMLIIM